MSFGSLFDGGAGGGGGGMQFPYSGGFSSSPALSLGLDNAGGMGGRMLPGGAGADGGMARDADAENDSRSGSDHLDAMSGGGEDEVDAEPGNPRKRKKRYHRHTPQQIQELEALFKECPHPDEKQRGELSKRLGLDPRQVKFWFQNRRTQMKTQLERHENALLKQENDKLRAESMTIREAMRSPMCGSCGSPAMLGEVSLEEQHLRIENARLKDELNRVYALATKFLGKPMSILSGPQLQPHLSLPMPSSSLELAVGSLGCIGSMPSATMPGSMSEFAGGVSSPLGTVITPARATGSALPSMVGIDRSMLLELAISAMDELVKMAQMDDPLWVSSLPSSPNKEMLNFEEYVHSFLPCIGMKPVGFVSEASRDSGLVIIDDSVALVETLMDERRWSDMFSCMIAKATVLEEVSTGIAGSRNGALLLMKAELQVLSPLVPIREVTFLRFCKQLAEGAWAVVDVSIDGLVRDQNSATTSTVGNMKCRRLPSGCVMQDTPNGYCKVTWVKHTEYDEASVHQLYRPLLQSGLAFGARWWLAMLQRQCECLAILMTPDTVSANDSSVIMREGNRSMLKLALRMTKNFSVGWWVFQRTRRIVHMIPLPSVNDSIGVSVPGVPQVGSTSDMEEMGIKLGKALQTEDISSGLDAAKSIEWAFLDHSKSSQNSWFPKKWLGVENNARIKSLSYQAAVDSLLQAVLDVSSRGNGINRDINIIVQGSLSCLLCPLETVIKNELTKREPTLYQWYSSDHNPLVVMFFDLRWLLTAVGTVAALWVHDIHIVDGSYIVGVCYHNGGAILLTPICSKDESLFCMWGEGFKLSMEVTCDVLDKEAEVKHEICSLLIWKLGQQKYGAAKSSIAYLLERLQATSEIYLLGKRQGSPIFRLDNLHVHIWEG